MTAIPPAGRDARPQCSSCGGDVYHYAGCAIGEHGEIIKRPAAAPRPAGPTPEGEPMEAEWVRDIHDLAEQHDSQSLVMLSKRTVLKLCDSHESLRTALASARAALEQVEEKRDFYDEWRLRVERENETLEVANASLQAALSEATRERDDWRARAYSAADGLAAERKQLKTAFLAGHATGAKLMSDDPPWIRQTAEESATDYITARAALPEETRHDKDR